MEKLERMNDYDIGFLFGIAAGFIALMSTIIIGLLIGIYIPEVMDDLHSYIIMLLGGIPILMIIIVEINMKYGESPVNSSKDDPGS